VTGSGPSTSIRPTGGDTLAVKAKIGVLVMALLEDDYNKTAHMRPAATAAAQEVADALAAFGDVVHAGLVEEEDDAAAAARLFNAEDVDIIVAAELAYTKGVVPARCFIDTIAPVLVWNTQKIRRFGEDDDFDVIMLNSGMAGMPELTAVLLRTGRDFEMITSQWDDEDGRRRVHEIIQAAAVRRRLRGARVGLVGHPFEGMTDLMVDGLSLRQTVGPVVWPLEPEKIAVRFGDIPQTEVDALVAAERAKYAVEMEPALFERSARLALAMESAAREQRFDIFTALDQVWLTDPRVGIIPSYGTGRLCEIGIPAAPEGDVSCGVAQLILQELAGQSTTVENYVIDFDNNAVVFSHDGHGNPALAAPGTVKVKHSIYYTGVHGFGAGFEFAYRPGPVTNLALVPLGPAGWRFVISEGQFLDYTPRPVSAPQTLFRHDALRIAEWCTAWCKAGAPHHMAAAQGRWTSHLLALARMLQIEAVVV
jgi:L-arabinose isomerase